MTKFLFFTDVHLKGENPLSRIDNYSESIIEKLNEIVDIANEQQVDFTLFGGDFYDTHRIYNYKVMRESISALKRLKSKLYYIIGQHDLKGYNIQTFATSASCFTFDQLNGKAELLAEATDLGDAWLIPSHVNEDIYELTTRKPVTDKPTILLAHHLISNQSAFFDIIPCKDVAGYYDLILSGDLHKGVEYHEQGGTKFFNPGAVSRKTIDKIDRFRDPAVGIITVDKNKIDVEKILLKKVKPQTEVFGDKIIEHTPINVNVDKFVDELQSIKSGVINIYELLSKVKKGIIPRSVLDYILSKRPAEI